MTIPEYWRKEIDYAASLATEHPQVLPALLIALQLRDINTTLDQIRAQLNQIEDQLSQ